MNPRNNTGRLLAAAACAAILAIAGCGSDEEGTELPASASQALRAQLQSIQNRIDDGSVGACRDIIDGDSTNSDSVNRILDGLPGDVDPDVRDATRDSFDHLFELVQEECSGLEDNTDTETTPTETQTETTPTETQTETTPTETQTETTTTETLPLAPPGNGKQKDKGNGNSQGGGQAAPGGK